MFRRKKSVPVFIFIVLIYVSACAAPPDDSSSPFQMGLVVLDNAEYEMAYDLFDKAIAEDEEHAEAYYYRAYALSQFALVKPTPLPPPQKPAEPVIPEPPPEPENREDVEAVAAYLEALTDYQSEIKSIQATAESALSDYEAALTEYQTTVQEHAETWRIQYSETVSEITADLNKALELGVSPELEELIKELLGDL